jgi:hypothetical protein
MGQHFRVKGRYSGRFWDLYNGGELGGAGGLGSAGNWKVFSVFSSQKRYF